MSFLSSRSPLQTVFGRALKLAVGSAVALGVSGLPAIAYTQFETSKTTLNYDASKSTVAVSAAMTDEEKIDVLEAAVAKVDTYNEDSQQVDALRGLAQSYSDLGLQGRAIELLDRAVAIVRNSNSQYLTPMRVVPTYIEIGEVEAAEHLMAQIVADGNARTNYFIKVAEAYGSIGDAERELSTLSRTIDRLESLAAQENQNIMSAIGSVATAYNSIEDERATPAALFRLVQLAENEIIMHGTEISGDRLAVTLSQLSVAYSKQGNAEQAEALAARAMEIIRSGEETGYTTAEVATAYGYIQDREISEPALATIRELAVDDLGSTDPIGPYSALGAVAIAYDRLGHTEKSEEAIAVLTDTFGDSLYMLGAILSLHVEMDNAAAKEATIQKMFEMLPLLREANLVVSDVTAGYSGLTGIVEGYVYTEDDAIAQERLALLESFFTEVHFDPLYFPGQLAILARAAASRGDRAAAQRLLEDGTQRLEADIDACERYCTGVINSLAAGYTRLEDDQARQSGFDKLQQIADDNLDDEVRDSVSNTLTLYRAVL